MADKQDLSARNLADVVLRLADICRERSNINKRFGNTHAEMFWGTWAVVLRQAHRSGKRQAGAEPSCDNSERELN